jgi:hypothetical protein
MIIEISIGNYGFSHDWTLSAYGKKLYLGQDVKFCSRVLGMSPREVVMRIGTNNLRSAEGRTRLARLIVSEIGITRKNIKTLDAWDICAQ